MASDSEYLQAFDRPTHFWLTDLMARLSFGHMMVKAKEHKEVLIGVFLSLLLSSSLFALNSIETLTARTGIGSVVWIIILISMNISAITLLGYIFGRERGQRFLFIATLSFLILYIFLYYLRLSSSDLAIAGTLLVNTRLIASLGIVILFGIAVYYLLRKEVLPFFLRASLAFLTILSTFSYFSFVADSSSRQTVFTLDLLNIMIYGFSPLPWLLLTSLTLAFVSRADLNFKKMKEELPTIATLFCVYFVAIFSVYLISISGYGVTTIYYWQQSFLMFIVWDFVYRSAYRMYDQNMFKHGFITNWREIVYYSVLFAIVLFSSYIFGAFFAL